MKKIIIASIFMISGLLNAQNFQGMAVYESKTSTADFMKGMSGNRDMTPEMQKQLDALTPTEKKVLAGAI